MAETVTIRIDGNTRTFLKDEWERMKVGELDADSTVLREIIKQQNAFILGLVDAALKDVGRIEMLEAELAQALKRGNPRGKKKVEDGD